MRNQKCLVPVKKHLQRKAISRSLPHKLLTYHSLTNYVFIFIAKCTAICFFCEVSNIHRLRKTRHTPFCSWQRLAINTLDLSVVTNGSVILHCSSCSSCRCQDTQLLSVRLHVPSKCNKSFIWAKGKEFSLCGFFNTNPKTYNPFIKRRTLFCLN
jgi:hypothetical protein